tara:strand:- start:6 stop:1277 length:1272 start_codon:yes stop_codon:yes gene_type:complete
MQKIDIKKYFSLFIAFTVFYAIFYLYFKHDVGNDSSISEWLINYQGGFTRRGLGGEITTSVANFFSIPLRKSIFFIQSILHISYLFLIFTYIKNLKLNIFQIFALFTPLFLLYPVAELEALGRKEMLLFLFFIIALFFCQKKYPTKAINSYVFVFFPILCLIWEQVILFAPFIFVVLIIKNNLKTFKKVIINLFIIFVPSSLVIIMIFLFPLSDEGHKVMCDFLQNKFGEICYMSADLLIKNTVYFDTLHIHNGANFFPHYFRYIMIFLIGFMPLHILLSQNEFVKKNNFITKNFKLNILFFTLYSPVIILFIFGYDWGRWMHILYSFSILLYFYMFKSSIITNNFYIKGSFWEKIFKKKIFLAFVFFIFAFFWNPKTVMKGDIATNTLYKIIYNSSKRIFSYNGLRIFQDNPIIKFHKNYIE